jgi:Secretion system C-terminal sorting domain
MNSVTGANYFNTLILFKCQINHNLLLYLQKEFKMRIFCFFMFLLSPGLIYGQGWNELGSGSNALNPNDAIYSICADTGNIIYAAGTFTSNGLLDTNGRRYVAKWNGTFWQELCSDASKLNANWSINTICVDRFHNVYAAGGFFKDTGHFFVAKWDGSVWSEVGPVSSRLMHLGGFFTLCTDKFGNLYAAGHCTDSAGYYYVAKWDGTTWSQLGTGANALKANNEIYSICTDTSGNIYAGGSFNDSGRCYVAKWDGTTWKKMGYGNNPLHAFGYAEILSLCVDKDGNLFAGGWFFDSSHHFFVTKWDGTDWSELGSGGSSLHANGSITSIATDNESNIFAGGMFTDSNGRPYIAKWDGTNWSQLGTGTHALNASGGIYSVCTDNQGTVYAATLRLDSTGIGNYYVAQFNKYKEGITIPAVADVATIYPNPTSDYITLSCIRSNSGENYSIYDATGKFVEKGILCSSKNIVDVKKYDNGIYYLILTNEPAKIFTFIRE